MGANLAGKFILNSLEALSKQAPDALKFLDNPNPASKKIYNSYLGKKGNEAVGEELLTATKNNDYSYLNRFKDDANNSWNELHQGNQQSKRANPTDQKLFDDTRANRVYEQSSNRLQANKLIFDGYETPDVNAVNEYARNEILSYLKTGKGTGNHISIKHLTDPEKVKRIKLDPKDLYAKGEFADDPVRKYSWKDVDVKNKESAKQDATRGPYAVATTTTKKNIGSPQVKKPAGTIWHHSIPSQSTGKIYEAYMRHINPKFKLTKNAPRNREFLRMLKEIEEEFGVKFGDDPLNARYLKDKPEHDIWHVELKNQGIDPKQIKAGLNGKTLDAMEARKWLRKLAEASLAVDKEMGFNRLALTP